MPKKQDEKAKSRFFIPCFVNYRLFQKLLAVSLLISDFFFISLQIEFRRSLEA
jgi:hypothetical protein